MKDKVCLYHNVIEDLHYSQCSNELQSSPLYIQRKKNTTPKMLLTFTHSINIAKGLLVGAAMQAINKNTTLLSRSLYSSERRKRNKVSKIYSMLDNGMCYCKKIKQQWGI